MSSIIKCALLFCLGVNLAALAGDPPKYEVSKIPAELLKGAQAVVRTDEQLFDIQDASTAIITERYAITIFSSDADFHVTKKIGHDNFYKIKHLEGYVYDQFGKQVARLKKSDIQDMAAFDGVSFVSDSRVKIATLPRIAYPFTVEYQYQYENRNLLFYTTWYAQSNPKESVENCWIEVRTPPGFPDLRYYGQNLTHQVKTGTLEGKKTYRWEWQNLPVMPKNEPYCPSNLERRPILHLAPSVFEVAGYKGELTSWQALGQWQNLLNEGRQALPAETQAKVQQMTANLASSRDKVKALYEYMQSRTRYVGIQLGIGGWQTFPASEVDSKGYGDCKALSNYMKSLLAGAGIESHYTLINAGNEARTDFLPSFPSAQFNHVILCVPLPAADTLWLECTSQHQAAGYMSDFTDNRPALLVTPEGGKLVRTPKYGRADNFRHCRVAARITPEGHATATMEARHSGLLQDQDYMDWQPTKGRDEQKKWLLERIDLPNFELTNFDLSRQKTSIPVVTQKMSLKINQLATISGKRMFVQPNLLAKWETQPVEMENRRHEVEVSSFDYATRDTVTLELPAGFHVEHLPEALSFKSVFGEYHAQVTVTDRTLTYVRRSSINQGVFPKEKYQEWVIFCRQMIRADRLKIVLVNNT
jgi:transglutaminase-like putative cysteine protease